MKNILLVFTGGTIGSCVSDGTINTSGSTGFQLLELFKQHYPKHQQISFKTIQPLQLLSENLAPPAWKSLIAAIEAAQPEQYDGVIITHGTDTLAYTACALSFYFNALNSPMLLVSSDYPLADSRANGLANFICAVDFIAQNIALGVFVPYRNQDQATNIHLASRLTCSLQLTGEFMSVQDKCVMAYTDGQFSVLNPINIKHLRTPLRLQTDFSKRVLMVKPYPGLDYSSINLNQADAVLHDLYHSGTACVSQEWGGQLSLLGFIERCKQQNLSVFLAPIIKSANAYGSTRTFIGQGGVVIWNMSIEAAYVKLILAYGNFTDEQQRIEFINTDIAGELV